MFDDQSPCHDFGVTGAPPIRAAAAVYASNVYERCSDHGGRPNDQARSKPFLWRGHRAVHNVKQHGLRLCERWGKLTKQYCGDIVQANHAHSGSRFDGGTTQVR
jgi:hypothetical protein